MGKTQRMHRYRFPDSQIPGVYIGGNPGICQPRMGGAVGDQSKPDRKAIPTLYRGVQFRSRLEAKWAAFFDAMGWPWQYEPFDLAGWIPDFLIGDRLVAEVKPVTLCPPEIVREIDEALPVERDEFDACEMGQREPIILGCVVPAAPIGQWGFKSELGVPIGWLRGVPAPWQWEREPRWGLGIVGRIIAADVEWSESEGKYKRATCDKGFGIFHSDDAQLYGHHGSDYGRDELYWLAKNRLGEKRDASMVEPWGACDWDVANPNETDRPDRLAGPVIDAWNKAGNLTQWRGVRSVVR